MSSPLPHDIRQIIRQGGLLAPMPLQGGDMRELFHPGSPMAARVALRWLIEQLCAEEATALWRLICSWMGVSTRQSSEDQS